MRTPEELTTLTIDFLSEHTNEAALAVGLGIVWHLVWERPKHLQNMAALLKSDPIEPTSNITSRKPPVLRGNLKKELELVLQQNEELEIMLRELRLEIENKGTNFSPESFYHPIGARTTRKRIRNAGLIRTSIGMTTDELHLLGWCWALLAFGYCLVASRKRRKRDNPISTAVGILEKAAYTSHQYFQEDVLPAISKIRTYFGKEFDELYSRIIDAESSTGRAIIKCQETYRSTLETVESTLYDRMLPTSIRYSKQCVEYTHLMVNTIAAMELPKWKESPPTILLSEHEEQVQTLKESLHKEETDHKALREKVEGLEMALRGKEVLLYEERMKTRTAKLEAHRVTIEREETRRRESLATKASALAAVAEDQRRLLRGFLSEHILSRQQQDTLRRIEEKNAPKKSKIVLPDPILQGFASAMYINNVSDLSSAYTSPSERQQQQQRSFMDCRDDAYDEDEYYGNPNETRLREIKEQFLRSKTVSNTLKPSHIDARDGNNKASTGSLLWHAANPATIAKDAPTKKYQSLIDRNLTTRAPQQPTSWMEDPASIMCDWRTNGNEDETRE